MQEILVLSQKHSELLLQQIFKFIMLATKMKNDIILVQLTSIPASDPPDILLPLIMQFLQNSCGISKTCVTSCWEALKSAVWYESNSFKDTSESDFAEHSHSMGLCLDTLYPPHHTCMNSSCSQSRTGKLLKQCEQQRDVLYTFARGAQPICSAHLYCELCNTNYHYNFSVKDGTHTYYDGAIPDVLQVGEHQFAEWRLLQAWIMSMLLSWTSATNCAHQYNQLNDSEPPVGWQFGFAVTTEQVWDGFVILALLEDCQ
ncbi:hypothetical protein L208DRAFT_1285549 [Tricholoma matsutake]|nr:hypothetical protein L208DRAFT_1285549 [Tricholoma matsutake 945]